MESENAGPCHRIERDRPILMHGQSINLAAVPNEVLKHVFNCLSESLPSPLLF